MLRDFCSFSNSLTAFDPPWVSLDPCWPHASLRSLISFSSRISAASSASFLAASTRSCAALKADAMSLILSESLRVASRRVRASVLVARWRARPIWPCEARAAKAAMVGVKPSWVRSLATAVAEGVLRVNERVRERIVGRTSVVVGAQSSQTVRRPGSSTAFKRALAADSVRRSASSITTTR